MKVSGINFVDEKGLHSKEETQLAIDMIASGLENYQDRAVVLESDRSLLTSLRHLAVLKKKYDVLMLPSEEFHNPEYFEYVTSVLGPVYKWALSDEAPEAAGKGNVHPLLNGNHFIVKTSGTSGMKNKFVLHNPEMFIQKYTLRKAAFEKTLNFFPPDSIAGIETLLECMVHGKVIVNFGKKPDPTVIRDLVIQEKIDYLFVTPTFLNTLLFSGNLNEKILQNVRTIAFGSEPSQSRVLSQIKDMAPQIILNHIYGMSEIGLQASIPGEDPSWFKLDTSKNPFRLENGQLIVKSETPMIAYLNHEKKVSEGWFETGDVIIEESGALKVIGRSDDVINVAGKKFHPIELEELLMNLDGVQDVMVTSEPHDLIGNMVIAHFTCPVPDENFRKRLKAHLENNVPTWMRPQKVVFVSASAMSPRLKKKRKTSI